jgi:hypothetical protein
VEPLGELKKSLRTSGSAVSSLLGAISNQTPAGAGASAKSPGAYQLYIWGKLVAQQPKAHLHIRVLLRILCELPLAAALLT